MSGYRSSLLTILLVAGSACREDADPLIAPDAAAFVADDADVTQGAPDAGASDPDAALAADAEPEPARPVCRSGRRWSPGDRAYEDATDAWGLGALEGPTNALATADVDGDGWADLVSMDTTTNARGKARLWMNRPREGGGRRFVDETESRGLLVTRDGAGGRVTNLMTFGDVDNDGDVDAFSGLFRDLNQAATGDRAELLLNDGEGRFSLAELPPPIGPRDPLMTSAAFLDQDLDGRLDLFTVYWYAQPPFSSPFGDQPQLMRGFGDGSFGDVTMELGLGLARSNASLRDNTHARPLFGGTVCDVSGDGRPDLIGAAYGRAFNLLWQSEGDRYVERGRESGVAGDERTSVADDQSYRCFCAGGAGRCPADVPAPLRGYPCPGRGWQVGYSDQPRNLNGNTFSIACGDVDNDGDMDLYTGEIKHPDVGSSSDPSELLRNEGGMRFSRPGRETMGLTPPLGSWTDEGGQNSGLWDFDGDGRLDVYLGGSAYDANWAWLFHQKDDGSFEWIGADAGFRHACPHGLAVADFDHDGDQDVVVGTYGCGDVWGTAQPLRLYENVASEANWLSIKLRGAGVPEGANASGIGAHVLVTAGGRTQTIEVRSSWGRVALGTEPVAHVGLGEHCTADRIEVRWPNRASTTSVFVDVPANQRIEIVERGEMRALE